MARWTAPEERRREPKRDCAAAPPDGCDELVAVLSEALEWLEMTDREEFFLSLRTPRESDPLCLVSTKDMI